MKKSISSVAIVIAATLLLSACSAKSFTLSNIKRHLTGATEPTPTTLPSPTTTVKAVVTVKPSLSVKKLNNN